MAKKAESIETDTLPAAPALVTVTATVTLAEGGTLYHPGDTLETTPERAAALGPAVK
jgi:hypothetical protein